MADHSTSSPNDHADVRIVPPVIYVVVFAFAALLQKLVPLGALPKGIARGVGSVLLGGGVVLCGWSILLFRRAQTSLVPIQPTTSLVSEGPYRFTRNPMYLGLLFVYLGVAFLRRMVWGVMCAPIVVVIVNQQVIKKEERYLERKFGNSFVSYKSRVRRWL